jgi:cell division septation protein DedD
MEEQTSWKAHTFTLLVFTGIVVLCSIFFVLGMLVGRAQGQKIASNIGQAAVPPATEEKPEFNEKPDYTFHDETKKQDPAILEPKLVPRDPPATFEPPPRPDPQPNPPPEITSKTREVVNYQIGAIRKSADAEKLLNEVKKKGFRAFILAPAAKDPNPLCRVQVGPIDDPIGVQEIKKKLEAAGYRPILKK